MLAAFSTKQDEKHLPVFGKRHTYLVNGEIIWQNSAQLFGKIQYSCLAKFKQLFGKIQYSCLANFSTVVWQNSAVSEVVKLHGKFFAKLCASPTFAWRRKFGEIDPRYQMISMNQFNNFWFINDKFVQK
jgi:hypothetical protein